MTGEQLAAGDGGGAAGADGLRTDGALTVARGLWWRMYGGMTASREQDRK